jgi:LmbE family N-acetylglucosaminyl deacetylase
MARGRNMLDGRDSEKAVLERAVAGEPHKGRVFIAVHSHLDDIPRFCAGTLAKLIREGYAGYVIRATNDELRGESTAAHNIAHGESEHSAMAAALGIRSIYDFHYRDGCLNSISSQEFRFRLVLLLRRLKPDTVFSFSPRGEGEDDPDHRVTGCVVEEACRACSAGAAYPELLHAGLQPHPVPVRYHFVCRPAQQFNRVVDISPTVDEKIAAILRCNSRDGGRGSGLRNALAREGKRLPALGDTDESADREYVRNFMMTEQRALGEQYGVTYAEAFNYVDYRTSAEQAEVERYVRENAVSLH